MFNSCLVLQVSYFTSIIDHIFKYTTSKLVSGPQHHGKNFEDLKKKNDINFQNMMSIARTYKKYLAINIDKNSIYNTIILAQCARHSIVHSLGKADEKFIKQTEEAKPRDIKPDFLLNDKIQFSSSELEYVKLAMQHFVENVCDKIREKYQII